MKSIFREHIFSGKTALITGGGSGIGFRTAKELSSLGATVILAGRDVEKLEKAGKEIASSGRIAHTAVCNIREEESVQACVKEALEKSGKIDLLVNNAGGQFPSNAEKISKKGWHAVLETNLTGSFLVAREVFLSSMREHGGAIVNVTMNMRNGFPMMAHSAAARAGVENLTRSLSTEWGRYGVRVNSIAPGIIRSSGLDSYDPAFKEFVLSAAKNNQSYRPGTEAETASAIIFLLSPGAAFITGETLRVDGGEALYSPLMPPVKNDRFPVWDD